MNPNRPPRFILDEPSYISTEVIHTEASNRPNVDMNIYFGATKAPVVSNAEIQRKQKGNSMEIESITASIHIRCRLTTNNLYRLYTMIRNTQYNPVTRILNYRRRVAGHDVTYMICGFSNIIRGGNRDESKKYSTVICSGSKTVKDARMNLHFILHLLNTVIQNTKAEDQAEDFVYTPEYTVRGSEYEHVEPIECNQATFNDFRILNYKAFIRLNTKIKLAELYDDLSSDEKAEYRAVYIPELSSSINVKFLKPHKFTFLIFATGYITVYSNNIEMLGTYWKYMYDKIKGFMVSHIARK